MLTHSHIRYEVLIVWIPNSHLHDYDTDLTLNYKSGLSF